MARGRARVAALQPLNEKIAAQAERERQTRNFACIERHVAARSGDMRDQAILAGRDRYGYDWDAAIRYGDGYHAAIAGWEPRFPATPSRENDTACAHAAYLQGFRDGGGQPDDLFDTARRAYAAAAQAQRARRSIPVTPNSRPRPSDWPCPTDAPRPTCWSKRLIIIGAQTTRDRDGGLVAMLRAQPGHEMAMIIVADAGHGFHPWSSGDEIGTRAQADQLRALIAGFEMDDILIMADGDDLAWIDRHAGQLPLCRTMERTRHSGIQQRGQFRAWLDRGLRDGEVLASGHIRWTKIAQGLSGRLGEFATRYAGPAQPRGHRIVVELKDGKLASGFMTPQGEPLVPETVITNKAHLRKAMTIMLRRFAAAIPQHHAIAA
ncbi:MAG TPA: hypothetical protein VF509_11600 [Sphingobium sp.]